MILPEYNGKGFVTVVVDAVVRFEFEEINLNSIEAVMDPVNRAKERIIKKRLC
jgi:[ribosomal protein S5]-alanine N-acetyltransferase